MDRASDVRVDIGRQPDWLEFEVDPDVETVVSPKAGFTFVAGQVGLGDWRLRPSSTILYVEYWNGSAWIEKGRFTA